jgi:hypothetical protein
MKLLYLDNNALIYLFENRDSRNTAAYEELRKNAHRLAFSMTTIIEVCQSPSQEQAMALAASIDDADACWLDSYLDVQCAEFHAFLARCFFKQKQVVAYTPVRAHLGDLFPRLDDAQRATISASWLVQHMLRNDEAAKFGVRHEQHASVLTELQENIARGALTPMVDTIPLNNYLVSRLPERSPEGDPLSTDDKRAIIAFSLKSRDALFRQCPSVAAEYHLSDYRTAKPDRVPKRSDSQDLMFSCVALPYVDYLVTNDRYLKRGLDSVAVRLQGIQCRVYRQLWEVPNERG